MVTGLHVFQLNADRIKQNAPLLPAHERNRKARRRRTKLNINLRPGSRDPRPWRRRSRCSELAREHPL